MPRVVNSWWIRLDPVLGASLCLASALGLTLLIGTCLCVQRRKKQQKQQDDQEKQQQQHKQQQHKQQQPQQQQQQLDFAAVNGKCVLDDTSPALSAVFVNNNQLHHTFSPYYCTGSLPRHVEAHHSSPAHVPSAGASTVLLCNGSAATLPRRFSSGGAAPSGVPVLACSSPGCGCQPPRFEAQLSRSSQVDRELPPVPPPEPKLAAKESPGESGPELIRSRIEVQTEEVVELEEEDDSQYDMIARSPSSGLSRAVPAVPAAPTGPGPNAALSGPLPSGSLAALAASASAGSLSGVVLGARSGRTMTTATIDSDAGSEVDPLYACIRPGGSASRLGARTGSLQSGTGAANGLAGREDDSAPGGSLHVYSYIRKQMSSPVYQMLPRSSNALPNLPRSLRGSVESYASLGASYAAPSIPDRRYGQSEVDLIEQLRKNSAAATVELRHAGASPQTGSSSCLTGAAARHRRRSQSGVLLRHAAATRANWSPAGGARGLAVDGRLHAALADEERRHSQPALVSDDIMTDNSSSGGGAPETPAATREASYQRVTVRETLASLRARNALPQTCAGAGGTAAVTPPAPVPPSAPGLQSLSLTDDTSSLYERLDHSAGSHRRSFGAGSRQPLLPPRSAALSEAGDFYAEISGDEEDASEAYGEGEVVAAAASGLGPLRHSQSGPLRLTGATPQHEGDGAHRVMFEMRSFRHIDSDLDISQAATPVSSRRGFSRPLSPPPQDGPASCLALAHQRRSLMTPLMERSIEGSLFDDGASSMAADTATTAGTITGVGPYCPSSGSDYERLPVARSDGAATLEASAFDEEVEAIDLEEFDHSEAMTDSGLSSGEAALLPAFSTSSSGSSHAPALLPSPALSRPLRFPARVSGGDSSSGIASRASQASSLEPSVTGSPPSHSSGISSAASGGGALVAAGRAGRQLVTQLLRSFRKRSKDATPGLAVGERQRTCSDSSSVL